MALGASACGPWTGWTISTSTRSTRSWLARDGQAAHVLETCRLTDRADPHIRGAVWCGVSPPPMIVHFDRLALARIGKSIGVEAAVGWLWILASLHFSQLGFELFDFAGEYVNLVLSFLPTHNWADHLGVKVGNQVASIVVWKNWEN